MSDSSITPKSLAVGAMLGAGIAIATMHLLPTAQKQTQNEERSAEEPSSPRRRMLQPPPVIVSSLFGSPLPPKVQNKEGWEMAEQEACDTPRVGATFDDLAEIKNSELFNKIGEYGEKQTLVVGVAGGTGSGKTTLAQAIRDSIHTKMSFISHDNYYKDLTHLTPEERENHNFDHPDSLDTELMVEDLKKLKRGEAVDIPTYDFATHMRTKETEHVESHHIILVEGILIFTHEELRDLMDIRIFVDTAHDIRLIRRMSRDIAERGRTPDTVIKQYMKTVRPMHNLFVEPSKQHAHVIVPVGLNQAVLDLIISRLRFAAGE